MTIRVICAASHALFPPIVFARSQHRVATFWTCCRLCQLCCGTPAGGQELLLAWAQLDLPGGCPAKHVLETCYVNNADGLDGAPRRTP
jgi:hypothetical protein